ncbi:hypothetical protein P152DRAFT_449089 [Eremomyces bilateralis CBS 781.70]|uniref:Uncharacterized protein n=1 Tax=Eremomyces bilateralis CBS 781.70 TaxID=1392243 RepID=A0A6G1G4Y8_9PEZI|nr:uncharacterized protein P152DRAFT_449089 [Eremomyces bilateralis CBS 781.70]KAF1813001.1 hypothetical protein P152DRAFT_449089 [Eremomyces bilateralis CBS 781.70]
MRWSEVQSRLITYNYTYYYIDLHDGQTKHQNRISVDSSNNPVKTAPADIDLTGLINSEEIAEVPPAAENPVTDGAAPDLNNAGDREGSRNATKGKEPSNDVRVDDSQAVASASDDTDGEFADLQRGFNRRRSLIPQLPPLARYPVSPHLARSSTFPLNLTQDDDDSEEEALRKNKKKKRKRLGQQPTVHFDTSSADEYGNSERSPLIHHAGTRDGKEPSAAVPPSVDTEGVRTTQHVGNKPGPIVVVPRPDEGRVATSQSTVASSLHQPTDVAQAERSPSQTNHQAPGPRDWPVLDQDSAPRPRPLSRSATWSYMPLEPGLDPRLKAARDTQPSSSLPNLPLPTPGQQLPLPLPPPIQGQPLRPSPSPPPLPLALPAPGPAPTPPASGRSLPQSPSSSPPPPPPPLQPATGHVPGIPQRHPSKSQPLPGGRLIAPRPDADSTLPRSSLFPFVRKKIGYAIYRNTCRTWRMSVNVKKVSEILAT